ncbi:hypothetical protein CFP56_041060 [Quercus suber]|uniref:Uncharacterized protein n=1 Tax=Quercus suber TaxID=58331 RepID=A0AAW0LLE3_QUESU
MHKPMLLFWAVFFIVLALYKPQTRLVDERDSIVLVAKASFEIIDEMHYTLAKSRSLIIHGYQGSKGRNLL